MSDQTADIFDTSNSLVFEPHESIVFPDGTDASFSEISLRQMQVRPQRSKETRKLHGVFMFTFVMGGIVASDAAGEPHELLEVQSWIDSTIKTIKVETWVQWENCPMLVQRLLAQLAGAGYDIEALKDDEGKNLTFQAVTKWFNDHPEALTMGKENSNSWIVAEAPRGHDMLNATFVGQITDMQSSTKSVYDGLDDLSLLIQQQVEKSQTEEGLTADDRKSFQQLIGSILGFHTNNGGDTWPNKLGLNALNISDEQYSFYFDKDRVKVSDPSALFVEVADQQPAEQQDPKAAVDALFNS